MQISLITGKTVTKQGVFSRIKNRASDFSAQLLEHFLLQESGRNFNSSLFVEFGKVLLHDSTTLHLPQVLAPIFPGNHSNGEQKAVARIQTIFNIKSKRFINFSLGAFTQNDQSASGSILKYLCKGDLVIRDLGFFALHVFEQIIAAKAHFLSRLRFGVTITDENGKKIPLKNLLKQKQGVNQIVFIGSEKRIRVRLVMIPLPAGQSAEKIRKAKKDRDLRLNHSKEYYQWLRFNVYITTVQDDVWTSQQVSQAYKVRWQIEIIFKSWKSGFHLQGLLNESYKNEERVRVTIMLILLFICLVMKKIYVPYKKQIEKGKSCRLSLIKLCIFICNNFQEILTMPERLLKQLIILHCSYDKRSDRTNMTDLYEY